MKVDFSRLLAIDPIFLKKWNKVSYMCELNEIPKRQGIYCYTLNLEKFKKTENPKFFTKSYPVYIGSTVNFQGRHDQHRRTKYKFFDPVKSFLEYWFLPMLELDMKSIENLEKQLINALNPTINKISYSKQDSKVKVEKIEGISVAPGEKQVIQPFLADKAFVDRLLKIGENIEIEFKETFFYDTKESERQKKHVFSEYLKKIISEVVCAFLNTKGGYLLIGVNDNEKVVGLDRDVEHKYRGSFDLLRGEVQQTITKYLGIKCQQNWELHNVEYDDHLILLIKVEPFEKKTFVNKNEFWVRMQNGKKKLDSEEAEDWWDSKK